GRARGVPGPGAAVGFGGLRRARRAADPGDSASRTGAGHGIHRPAHADIHRPHGDEGRFPVTRRQALAGYALSMTGSRLLRGQKLAGEAPGRIPPVQELVNTLEFADIAERKLDSLT